MRYRPTVDFSVLVVLHPQGRMETFKYRGSELLCEASGQDFKTAMIHTIARGLSLDEPCGLVTTPFQRIRRRLESSSPNLPRGTAGTPACD